MRCELDRLSIDSDTFVHFHPMNQQVTKVCENQIADGPKNDLISEFSVLPAHQINRHGLQRGSDKAMTEHGATRKNGPDPNVKLPMFVYVQESTRKTRKGIHDDGTTIQSFGVARSIAEWTYET